MEKISESIVAMMKEYRKKRGWDQRAFADRMDVSKNTVWRYEKGEATPTLEVVERFAKLIHKPISELVTGEETEADRRKHKFLDDVWDAHLKWFSSTSTKPRNEEKTEE